MLTEIICTATKAVALLSPSFISSNRSSHSDSVILLVGGGSFFFSLFSLFSLFATITTPRYFTSHEEFSSS